MAEHNGHREGEHALVPCPVCGSTARRCKRPSGHEAMTWHLEREDALAELRRCECARCEEWLRSRGRRAGGAA